MHFVLLSMHIDLFVEMGFCDCYLYHLSPFTAKELSWSDNGLFVISFHVHETIWRLL